RAGHGGEAKRMGDRDDVRGASAARYSRCAIRADRHASHSDQVDANAVAKGATSPIVTSATHRQGQVTITCGSNRQGHVFGGPAMDNGAWHTADRLRPNRNRVGIAGVARRRHTAAQSFTKSM